MSDPFDARPEQERRTGAGRTDRLLSASAALVAVSALLVSVYQAYLTREQQKASAWPYVVVANAGAGGYSRVVQNVGLGPALVRSTVVEVDGRPQQSWGGVIRASLRLDSARFAALVAPAESTTYTSTLRRGAVLLPGATLEVFHTGPGPFAREFGSG